MCSTLNRPNNTIQALPMSLPLLCFSLLSEMELRAFLLGSFFFCTRLFEQPEGDFNMLLPFDTVAVLEVGEL